MSGEKAKAIAMERQGCQGFGLTGEHVEFVK
jgi:hypothetical protein